MPEPVRLEDVARAAGVHASTASRALNPGTRSVVNVETVRRVLAAAEELGYRPHPMARGLRTNRTMTIGMVVPDLTNPLFPPIYAGAAKTLNGFGYALMIVEVEDGGDAELWVGPVLRERRVDGLILATAHLDETHPTELTDAAIPAVLVNRSTADPAFPAIVGDDHAGIGLVVEHLASLGHTRIAHVAGSEHLSTGLNRRTAFEHWTRSLGLDADPGLIVASESFRAGAGSEACEELLTRGLPFTAIVAANDLIALGCYDALARHGLDVPGDVSVTGYNDMRFVDRVSPPLTSVAVDYTQMGVDAARTLLDLLGSPGAAHAERSIKLPPELVARRSTAAVGEWRDIGANSDHSSNSNE
jgi:LacI family transcriptional regulator, galactose operon repressor